MTSNRIWIKDELMANVHTKQILFELKERIPKTHLRNLTDSDGVFEVVTLRIPRKIWLSSYPNTEEIQLWEKGKPL